MKKYIIAFAAFAFLSAGTAFTSVHAFSDRSGLAEPVENTIEISSKDDGGLFGRLRRKMGSRYALNQIADRLRLTKEQRAEIRAIIEAEIPIVRPILLNTLAVHQQLKELGRDGVYNEVEVQRLAALQSQNARLLIIEKEKVKAQIFAVLTPEQIAEAEAIRDEIETKIRSRISEETGTKF
jgi:Spy/CpxP family protein refolding chaperone